MRRSTFLFVLEQALGHVVHTMNIERVLGEQTDIAAEIVRISPGAAPLRSVPIVGNWSVQASWAARHAIIRRISTSPPDALFIHTQVAALLASDAMRKVPTVVSMDATPINFDTVGQAYGHRRQPDLVERCKRAVTRRTLQRAQAVVTWSRWAAASAIADYGVPPDRVHPIPPGVDLQRFRPCDEPRDPGPVRILFVGGDFERKGGLDLLAAMSVLDRPVELDIVSSSARAVASPRVRVHASVAANSPLMTELYRRADMFVLPSRGDCTPLAVAEALASGLPVVATPVGALRELVVDGENGLLVPTRDPLALATALGTLIDRPDLRSRLGRRSRRLAEDDHDVDRNCRRIFDVMAAIASVRRARCEPAGTRSA